MEDETVEINVTTEPESNAEDSPIVEAESSASSDMAFTLGQIAERATTAEANAALALAKADDLAQRIEAMQQSQVVSDLIDSSIEADIRAAEAEATAEAVVEAAEEAAEESTGEEMDFEIVDSDAPVIEVNQDEPPSKGHFFTRPLGKKS